MITNYYKPFAHPLDWWDEAARAGESAGEYEGEYDEDLDYWDAPNDPKFYLPESWLIP